MQRGTGGGNNSGTSTPVGSRGGSGGGLGPGGGMGSGGASGALGSSAALAGGGGIRTAASVTFFAIYNPGLGMSEGSERDQLLFFYPKDWSLDDKIRQIGLAQALVNFCGGFSQKHCESVHTQRSRIALRRVEDAGGANGGYWMLLKIRLPSLRRRGAGASSVSVGGAPASGGAGGTSNTGSAAKDTIEYMDSVVSDAALQFALAESYRTFRLLHGTFHATCTLRSPAHLKRLLDLFFSRYITRWTAPPVPHMPVATSTLSPGGPHTVSPAPVLILSASSPSTNPGTASSTTHTSSSSGSPPYSYFEVIDPLAVLDTLPERYIEPQLYRQAVELLADVEDWCNYCFAKQFTGLGTQGLNPASAAVGNTNGPPPSLPPSPTRPHPTTAHSSSSSSTTTSSAASSSPTSANYPTPTRPPQSPSPTRRPRAESTSTSSSHGQVNSSTQAARNSANPSHPTVGAGAPLQSGFVSPPPFVAYSALLHKHHVIATTLPNPGSLAALVGFLTDWGSWGGVGEGGGVESRIRVGGLVGEPPIPTRPLAPFYPHIYPTSSPIFPFLKPRRGNASSGAGATTGSGNTGRQPFSGFLTGPVSLVEAEARVEMQRVWLGGFGEGKGGDMKEGRESESGDVRPFWVVIYQHLTDTTLILLVPASPHLFSPLGTRPPPSPPGGAVGSGSASPGTITRSASLTRGRGAIGGAGTGPGQSEEAHGVYGANWARVAGLEFYHLLEARVRAGIEGVAERAASGSDTLDPPNPRFLLVTQHPAPFSIGRSPRSRGLDVHETVRTNLSHGRVWSDEVWRGVERLRAEMGRSPSLTTISLKLPPTQGTSGVGEQWVVARRSEDGTRELVVVVEGAGWGEAEAEVRKLVRGSLNEIFAEW
ncbi:hypothetical protein M427DRAFT_67615 [Gonapodya prolifera JEL478]|uniref:CCZ1/INTU/HSP4 first Longin domain-containing protein n=1 Tax=Gonapodya prolifera (strain JEL478) TaxID=1344416 RepID=A0A139AP75_GONPJ|nr:hypothetical protein M427DRAFT_67615 [Gonapodya prolifera JEL478]|eukprot:KXS18561.1 hypothetical protein M427DRAFT_67615 [Gonapodya prolifera JEL478]